MMKIGDYLDLARKRQGFKSDSELSLALGLARIAVSTYRTERALPAPRTMLQIASFAGLNPDEALLNLGIWKSEDDSTAEAYRGIMRRLRGVAAAVALVGLFTSLTDSPASAREQLANNGGSIPAAVYYGK
ncbi:hypothetical protein [Thalassobaculum sp.]|uniref:hypothetical protein n=1 Tax=Thalassobaculum sp. TaxID=2022740 RepID=UPI0032EFA154